jgi:hypothetical protein
MAEPSAWNRGAIAEFAVLYRRDRTADLDPLIVTAGRGAGI